MTNDKSRRANAICHLDAWVIGDEDGRPYLEQHLVNSLSQLMNPIFLTGDAEWSDYTVEARIKPLSLNEMAGLVFRYHTNRHYYLFALTGGKRARLALRLPLEKTFRVAEWRELGAAEFSYDTKKYYQLKVVNEGPRIQAFIDDQKVLEASDGDIVKGKVGLTANIPARFQDFMLISQNIPRVRGDAFDHISCLTAVNFDGKVLWQLGRPDPRNGLLTNDTPFQIHDLDGDGKNEVVLVQDFKLQIREGKTGKLRHWSWMPQIPSESQERPYELNNGDSLAFFNLSGKAGRQEILVKDRYKNFWVFNSRLELLWQGQGQTGHFPYPFDVDGDGRDEILTRRESAGSG